MKKNLPSISFCITILIHVVGIWAFSFSTPIVKHKEEARMRIVTKEIATSRPSHLPVLVKENSTPSIASVIKKETPIKKKPLPTPKKQVPKKEKIATAQVKKKLEKAMVKMPPAIKSQVKAPEKNLPPTPAPLIDPGISSTYLHSICTLLEEQLTLPESGIVKLTITVQANGKLGMVKEISSESARNLRYLKEMLETFSFPSPDGKKEVEFTITFCGD
jgi:hypothetical protein